MKRLGRFKISEMCMPDVCPGTGAILAEVKVIERRHDFDIAGAYEFLAEGDVFDEVANGQLIPEYTIQITQHWGEDGAEQPQTHEWVRTK